MADRTSRVDTGVDTGVEECPGSPDQGCPMTHFCPYRNVTARWTSLTPEQQTHHALELLGTTQVPRRLLDPTDAAPVIDAAIAGNTIAFAWLACDLRPALLVVGRRLLSEDGDWGSVAVEALHRAVRSAEHVAPRWQRRRVHQRATQFMARWITNRHPRRTQQLEPAVTDPTIPDTTDLLALRDELNDILSQLPDEIREGFQAAALGLPLADVARRHGIQNEALRVRMCRSRKELRPRITEWLVA